MQTKVLNLLDLLNQRHPDLLIRGGDDQGDNFIIFRLGSFDEALTTSLEDGFGPHCEEVAYIVDMNKLDIVSPSAASALMTSVVSIAKERNVPIIFTHVSAEALQGLQTVNNTRQTDKVFWAVDIDGHHHFVGTAPIRFQTILEDLWRRGGASASDLAETSGESSKKVVNKFSVYLQELYTAGLVVREKIVGSDRIDGERGERGWTYLYRPAYSVFSSPSS